MEVVLKAEEVSREIGNLIHIERMLKAGQVEIALSILEDLKERKLEQFDKRGEA